MARYVILVQVLSWVSFGCTARSLGNDVQFTHFFTGFSENGVSERPGLTIMVNQSQALSLSWGFRCSPDEDVCSQAAFRLYVARVDNNETAYDSGLIPSSMPRYTIPLGVLQPATHYIWQVAVSAQATTAPSSWSPPQRFFTSLGRNWVPTPIWAPKNASGDLPLFAFLRADVALFNTSADNRIVVDADIKASTLFITANPPGAGGRPPKILGAYKVWVDGVLVGIGPGRPRCYHGSSCTFGAPEHMYDGFDITQIARAAAARGAIAVEIFVAGFGIGDPKVAAEVHVQRTSTRTRSHTGTHWDALDADAVYRPTGQSGCSWYYYPMENFNASAEHIAGTPLAPTATARRSPRVMPLWYPAQEQQAFVAPLVPKPVAPVSLLPPAPFTSASTPSARDKPTKFAAVRQIGPGHYAFDLGREVQGGVVLTIALSPAQADANDADAVAARKVTLRVNEELSGGVNGTGELYWPPRTGVNPESIWTLAPTTEPQTIMHHEYMEFRYGELFFGTVPPPSPPSPGPPSPPLLPALCIDHAAEHSVITLGCPSTTGANAESAVISEISFASFGMPTGSCHAGDNLRHNVSCDLGDDAYARGVLSNACMGRSSCAVSVPSCSGGPCGPAPWKGTDPCHGQHKWLSAAVKCVNKSFAVSTTSPGVRVHDFNVTAWVVRLPSDARDSSVALLSTADPILDSVWELCRYTLVSAPLDLYSDSNARQRSADCAADDVTAMRTHYATSTQLVLQRFAVEQMMAGGVADRVDWGVLPIIAVLDYTMHSGDLSLGEATFDRLLSAHARLQSISNISGLVEGIEALVDWPTGMQDRYQKSKASTISSAWVFYGAKSLAQLARLLPGSARATQATQLDETAAQLRAAMNAQQWNVQNGAFCDGVCDDTPHQAFHSTFYALAFDAVEEAHAGAAWDYVRSRISPPFNLTRALDGRWPPPEPSTGVGLPCGVYPAQYAVASLYSNAVDRGLSALRVLTSTALNSWVSMLRQGATMTMEMWNADEKPNLTWSHPWASSPAFIIAWYLFGIRPAVPGFAAVTVRPQPGDLPRGHLELPTIRGTVGTSFTQAQGGDTFALNVSLPATSVGLIALPLPLGVTDEAAVRKFCLRVNGAAPMPVNASGHFAHAPTVGPGGYHFFLLSMC